MNTLWTLSAPTFEPLLLILLHFCWQAVVIAIVWRVGLFLVGNQNSIARYRWSLFTLGLLAITPVISGIAISNGYLKAPDRVDARVVPAQPDSPPAGNEQETVYDLEDRAIDSPASLARWLAIEVAVARQLAYEANGLTNLAEAAPAEPFNDTATVGIVNPTVHPWAAPFIASIEFARRYQSWLLLAWLAGAVCFGLRIGAGSLICIKLHVARSPIATATNEVVIDLANKLKLSQARTLVFSSQHVGEAIAMGIFRPVVLIPLSWINQLPPDTLQAVLAHELAHLRRNDLIVNLLQRALETLFFFHPVVWWISNQVRFERECCCDRMAVMATGKRLDYAKALAEVAQLRLDGHTPGLVASFLGGRRMSLLKRVQRVLGQAPRRRFGISTSAGVVSLALVMTLTGVTVIAQQDGQRPSRDPDSNQRVDDGNDSRDRDRPRNRNRRRDSDRRSQQNRDGSNNNQNRNGEARRDNPRDNNQQRNDGQPANDRRSMDQRNDDQRDNDRQDFFRDGGNNRPAMSNQRPNRDNRSNDFEFDGFQLDRNQFQADQQRRQDPRGNNRLSNDHQPRDGQFNNNQSRNDFWQEIGPDGRAQSNNPNLARDTWQESRNQFRSQQDRAHNRSDDNPFMDRRDPNTQQPANNQPFRDNQPSRNDGGDNRFDLNNSHQNFDRNQQPNQQRNPNQNPLNDPNVNRFIGDLHDANSNRDDELLRLVRGMNQEIIQLRQEVANLRRQVESNEGRNGQQPSYRESPSRSESRPPQGSSRYQERRNSNFSDSNRQDNFSEPRPNERRSSAQPPVDRRPSQSRDPRPSVSPNSEPREPSQPRRGRNEPASRPGPSAPTNPFEGPINQPPQLAPTQTPSQPTVTYQPVPATSYVPQPVRNVPRSQPPATPLEGPTTPLPAQGNVPAINALPHDPTDPATPPPSVNSGNQTVPRAVEPPAPIGPVDDSAPTSPPMNAVPRPMPPVESPNELKVDNATPPTANTDSALPGEIKPPVNLPDESTPVQIPASGPDQSEDPTSDPAGTP